MIAALCAEISRYLGPGYWALVAPVSRTFYQKYSEQHAPHSDPSKILRSKRMIKWFRFMNRFICSEGDKSEWLRIVYRGLAGARMDDVGTNELLQWVQKTYGFVTDTLAFCAAIRSISLQPRNRILKNLILNFFFEFLEADASTASTTSLDPGQIYDALLAIPVTEDTHWNVMSTIMWLLGQMRIEHPRIENFGLYKHVVDQFPDIHPGNRAVLFHYVLFPEPILKYTT